MRTIASVTLDKRRPALVLTRQSKLHLLSWVTVAPITSTARGLASEVRVGPRNGLDHASVVSCDNITTVRSTAVGDTIGLLFDDQEPELARAVADAFDLFLGSPHADCTRRGAVAGSRRRPGLVVEPCTRTTRRATSTAAALT